MIKRILIAVIALVLGFAGYIAMQPAQFKVSRSATIAATPATVFENVNDLRKWQAWSPWAKKDPNAKPVFSGPSAGKDAAMAWSGNDEVGEGKMTIVESKPAELIRIKLDFLKPFEGTSNSEFAFKPEGNGTAVTWSLTGEQGFVERAICALMGLNMDKMIGGDYEAGLAALQKVAEGKG